MNKGASNKAPGREYICLEFYTVNWDRFMDDMLALFNQMNFEGRIMERQKHGIVVCLHKTYIPTTPADYKPITLLNTEYKILVRIILNQLRPTLSDMLHTSQYCRVRSNTIFDVVASVLYAISYAELTHAPLCILSLDFTSAFDRISHSYLFRMPKIMVIA